MGGLSHSRKFWPGVEVTVKKHTASLGTTTVVVTKAVSLPELVSGSLPFTVAVLVMLPAVFGVTTIVIVVLLDWARPARLQVTTPPAWLQVGEPGVTETKETPGGSASVTREPLETLGPLLVTVSV